MKLSQLMTTSAAGALVLFAAGCGQQVEFSEGEPGIVNVRRLTESQYRHTVADVFGDDISISGRFEPEMRDDGLLAVGSAQLSITPSGFQQYFTMAQSVAGAVVSEERRDALMPCAPADAATADPVCAEQIIAQFGHQLFRRPLREDDLSARLEIVNTVSTDMNDFYAGIQYGISSLLVSPDFLFRIEEAEAVPGQSGRVRLDGYSMASRLSYFFWDTAPDEELYQAAANGDLHTRRGLEAQVERLASSDRMAAGAEAFFEDMLQFDLFATLTKDPGIYPKYSLEVARSAQEQTLRTLVHHLVEEEGDYRDIFTTRQTYLNRTLAAVYQVPYLGQGDWIEYEFPEDDPRVGVLTHVSFLSLFSHPGRSSPTKRGIAVNEIYRCEPTPLPPANVDFSIVNDVNNAELRTVRQRLMAHSLDPSCSNCHDLSDPVGLSLEHFDSLGQYRTTENDALIDVNADIWGTHVDGVEGLSGVLRESDAVPACLVEKVFSYGVGRGTHPTETPFLEDQTEQFARGGYRYPALMQQIALTPEFFGFDPLTETELSEYAEIEGASAQGGQP